MFFQALNTTILLTHNNPDNVFIKAFFFLHLKLKYILLQGINKISIDNLYNLY